MSNGNGMVFLDEQNEALLELAKAVRVRAEDIYSVDREDDAGDLADAKDLGRALSRIIAGENLRAAFGSPGDWGYGTPIGKALAKVYATKAHL